MKRLLPLLLMLAFLLTGCASKLMTRVENETAPVLDNNTACITFYRASPTGTMIKAPIAEVVNGNDLKLVGIASYKTKLRYLLPAGNHEFVVGGYKGSILKAEVAPKKFYYVCIDPSLGTWKVRFHLKGLKKENFGEQEAAIKTCRLVTPIERAHTWLRQSKESMFAKLLDGRASFAEESAEKQAQYSLRPGDGLDQPLY